VEFFDARVGEFFGVEVGELIDAKMAQVGELIGVRHLLDGVPEVPLRLSEAAVPSGANQKIMIAVGQE
jgi:hypothetical protein